MYTADWWWNMQEKLPPGATIVPIICSYDITRQIRRTWLLALLPIPSKVIGDAVSKGRLRAWTAEILRSILSVVLEPLLHFDQSVGILMECSDGYERRCWPILAAWLADHVENCNLLSPKFNMCPKCEIPRQQTGRVPGGSSQDYARDQGEYCRMYRQYTALKGLGQSQ
ncbi:hypothetical protein DFP73DRAFT_601965 [Morchella snyderi]|nr:hypothetical protein DFP73DRAFT_601965 [Morchella snyderi]